MTILRNSLTKEQLIDSFVTLGLTLGDVVLVHSALRKLGPVDGGADTVIDALLEVVGAEGTVVMPTHTWKVVNAQQPLFHQKLTPSNVGALTNVFRQRAEAIRSIHPTHSVAAIGARAEELVAGHESDDTPCSAKGPYGRLRDWRGKVLIVGADLSCCTLFHGCEQWAGMAWAVTKQKTPLFCMTEDGKLIPTPMHAHFVNTWDQYPLLEPHLLAAGAMGLGEVGQCPLRLIDAGAATDWLIPRLQNDPSLILPSVLPSDFPDSADPKFRKLKEPTPC